MRYKLAIFDFDGTLADSFSWFLDAINEAAARHGFQPIDPARLDDVRGFSGRQLMTHLALPLWKVPAVTACMRQSMAKRIDAVRLFDGVDAMFRALTTHGVDVAVVTSNSRDNVVRVLGSENAALVRHYGCGASIFGKQAKFRHALQRCGVAPNEVLCVGDEIRDAEAAHALGLDFVGVPWGYTKAEALSPYASKMLCADFGELLAVASGE